VPCMHKKLSFYMQENKGKGGGELEEKKTDGLPGVRSCWWPGSGAGGENGGWRRQHQLKEKGEGEKREEGTCGRGAAGAVEEEGETVNGEEESVTMLMKGKVGGG